jgi:hypothetical protein
MKGSSGSKILHLFFFRFFDHYEKSGYKQEIREANIPFPCKFFFPQGAIAPSGQGPPPYRGFTITLN